MILKIYNSLYPVLHYLDKLGRGIVEWGIVGEQTTVYAQKYMKCVVESMTEKF